MIVVPFTETEVEMKIVTYGNPSASAVLIQPVGDHDLSPWKSPAVFGKDGFGDGAEDMLQFILRQCADRSKTYYAGGYSMAGLFSLWAAYQTDAFAGVAAASPSIWFPDFLQYMKEHDIRTESVYLSLGDREEKTRNPVMAKGFAWVMKNNSVCI